MSQAVLDSEAIPEKGLPERTRPAGVDLPPLEGSTLLVATLGISLVTCMTVLDSTIANVALPTIAGNMGVAASQGTWVITFFGVANAIGIPLTGWLAKRFGEVRLYCLGTLVFVLASLLCGLATNLTTLIIARIIQGAAAGPLMPLSQSLLLACYPFKKRALAMSLWSMTIVLAPVAGPILGGYICDNYSWHWIFFVNVPVGIFSLFLLKVSLKGRETPIARNPIDSLGLFLLVFGMGSLQLMLDEGKDKDWFASGSIIFLAVCAVVCLTLLVVWELGEKHPVVDFSLFRHRNFTVGTICVSLGCMFYIAGVVLQPMMLQTRMGYTAIWSGLSLASVGIFPLILSPLLGRFSDRLDMRLMVTFSFIMFAVTFLWRAYTFEPGMAFRDVVWPQFVQGIATGLFFMPLNIILISGLDLRDLASASSLSNCLRTLTGAIGTSLSTTLWERQEALHHVRLTEAINEFNPVATDTLRQLSAMGFSPEQSGAWMSSEITRQGFLMGFNELFWLGGILFLGLAALIWLATPIGGGRH